MSDQRRCAKCNILGESADIAEHEKICIAVQCPQCEGRGIIYSNGCIYPKRYYCQACDGHGVKGGLIAKANAQDYARKAALIAEKKKGAD